MRATAGGGAVIAFLIGIAFWVAVADIYVDRRYIRRGGIRPTSSAKRLLWIGIGVVIVADIAMFVGGVDADQAGRYTAMMLVSVMIPWSAHRRIVRRTFPISAVVK